MHPYETEAYTHVDFRIRLAGWQISIYVYPASLLRTDPLLSFQNRVCRCCTRDLSSARGAATPPTTPIYHANTTTTTKRTTYFMRTTSPQHHPSTLFRPGILSEEAC